EESSQPEEPPISSSDVPGSFNVDIPVPPLPKLIEPARESEWVSFPPSIEQQPIALVPEASAPEPSRSAVIPEVPPAPAPVSTEHREIPFTLLNAASSPQVSVAPSDAPSVSPASMDTDTLLRWNTGEVEVQSHRPSEKKRNWDKEKGEAPVDLSTPLSPVKESSAVVDELSRSGGWESV